MIMVYILFSIIINIIPVHAMEIYTKTHKNNKAIEKKDEGFLNDIIFSIRDGSPEQYEWFERLKAAPVEMREKNIPLTTTFLALKNKLNPLSKEERMNLAHGIHNETIYDFYAIKCCVIHGELNIDQLLNLVHQVELSLRDKTKKYLNQPNIINEDTILQNAVISFQQTLVALKN